MKNATDVVIVSALRAPIGKAGKAFAQTRPDDLAADVVREMLARTPEVAPDRVDDIVVGCAMPEGEQGMNMGRIIAFRAGLPDSVSAMTMNRFCASGLETIATAAAKIAAGQADIVVAGGAESMSLIPMPGVHPAAKFSPNPYLMQHKPGVYAPMLITAENVRAKYGISREDQDMFSLASHQNAVAAQEAGRFKEEIVPITLRTESWEGVQETVISADEGPRRDSTLEKLAKLEPAVAKLGLDYPREGLTVTAGNSSQMSDGAAFVMLMSRARANGLCLKPLARFVSYGTGGVAPEIMGIGPVAAVPKALSRAGLKHSDINLIEMNEAFAVQCLASLRVLGFDPFRVNVNGGAIALGHPLGCSGARLTVTLIHEMRRRGVQYGLVTMCVGGGQGTAGIFELE